MLLFEKWLDNWIVSGFTPHQENLPGPVRYPD
jgi:hypothetical protein